MWACGMFLNNLQKGHSLSKRRSSATEVVLDEPAVTKSKAKAKPRYQVEETFDVLCLLTLGLLAYLRRTASAMSIK